LEWTGDIYKAAIKRVAYEVYDTMDYTRDSVYGKEVRVWSGLFVRKHGMLLMKHGIKVLRVWIIKEKYYRLAERYVIF
jgi:hypothetical protein